MGTHGWVIPGPRRANVLLDAISARGQDMLKELDPACRLGRVNIDYLQAGIGNSREGLRHIMIEFRDEDERQEASLSLANN
ncbi:hypothetical protein diail_6970 [Diaporthe ilicicola]|nr:hypothetical protein diail_6970 [Diaporthe ilicicola]